MTRPRVGEPGHSEWVFGRVLGAFRERGSMSREAFLVFDRERAGGGIGNRRNLIPGYATRKDVLACSWQEMFARAKAITQSDTATGSKEHANPNPGVGTSLPLGVIPDGFEVRRIATLVDADGETERQWIDSGRERAVGELAEQLPPGHVLKGVSTLVGGDGRVAAQWVKTQLERESREQVLERLLRELPVHMPARIDRVEGPATVGASDLLAVYPIGDPHVGMLSWEPETGASFDLDKARDIMCAAMNDLVQRGPRTDRALIVNLGDYFHADNYLNRTSRSGHPLDVDGRWPKVLQVGIEILVYMIDRALEHHRLVRVINEIGNHDDHSAIMLSVALASHYRNEPRVEIDLSPSQYHWHKFGKCLIGVTHGHNQKHDDLESIMAAERAQDWGETEHRYWYVGHIHHSTKKEKRGCVIESFRTLAPRDAWAAGAGYRAGRDMTRITLHNEWGEVGREIVSANYLQAQYLAE